MNIRTRSIADLSPFFEADGKAGNVTVGEIKKTGLKFDQLVPKKREDRKPEEEVVTLSPMEKAMRFIGKNIAGVRDWTGRENRTFCTIRLKDKQPPESSGYSTLADLAQAILDTLTDFVFFFKMPVKGVNFI